MICLSQGILPLALVERVVELTVPQEQLAAKTAEAEELPHLEVTTLDMQWLQVIYLQQIYFFLRRIYFFWRQIFFSATFIFLPANTFLAANKCLAVITFVGGKYIILSGNIFLLRQIQYIFFGGKQIFFGEIYFC